MNSILHRAIHSPHTRWEVAFFITFFCWQSIYAQTADGITGLNQANTMVRSYFDPASQLMMGIGAVLGIIGGIKVYANMSSEHKTASKEIALWFGGCVFLVMVGTVLRSFFGL
ncbi:MAG: DUF4134 domain-containing protein [Chitinophaga rupis]